MSQEHSPAKYIKIWFILLVLLAISIIGPMFGIRSVTLITAFGIAVVKALMVAAYFMHLNIEKKFVHYMLYTMVALMGLFYAGVVVDILGTKGANWVNESALHEIERGNQAAAEAPHEEHP